MCVRVRVRVRVCVHACVRVSACAQTLEPDAPVGHEWRVKNMKVVRRCLTFGDRFEFGLILTFG